MSTVLTPGPIFVRKKHELSDTLKHLDGFSKEAVDLIGEAMMDENETRKNRIAYAEKIIDMKIRVADIISKDEFARQIAEVKASGPKQPLIDDTRRPSAPRLDMSNIQKV